MKAAVIVGLGLAGFLGVVGYRSDPMVIVFATGALFGVVAGIPMALLILAAQRRSAEQDHSRSQPAPQQQPMIMMVGGYPNQDMNPPHEVIDAQPRMPALTAKKQITHQDW